MNKSTGGGSNTNWKQRNGYSNNGNASDGPKPMDLGVVDKVQKLTPVLGAKMLQSDLTKRLLGAY
jgi:hypothetical protein